uniref:PH domain-containing protein n=1 Tax=Globisporangium ultimum (strain ATCC 200006 / CBS 805.95 / DAOM BR144) TaxID=431595 RepID=K3WVF6_GLOUD
MEYPPTGTAAGAATYTYAPAPPIPSDILLDGDRLNMLLDLVCADYITASYASRENGKKVIWKALEKLFLSVNAAAAYATHALAPTPGAPANLKQDPAFQERARVFYDELMLEFAAKRQEHAQTDQSIHYVPTSPRGMEDSLVREVLKPKLVQLVEEVCKERDRQIAANGAGGVGYVAPGSSSGSAGSNSAMRSVFSALSGSSQNAALAATVPVAPQVLAAPPTTGEIRMEGWLRKKGQHVNLWRERYFMIRSTPNGSHYLCYFRKKGDKDPRGWYVLGPGTTVDEVRESPSKIETKKLFTFRIRHLAHATSEEVDDASAAAPQSMIEGSTLSLPPAFTPSRAAALSYDFPVSPDGASSTMVDHEYDASKAIVKKQTSRKFRNRAAAAAAAATAATAVVLTGGLAGVGIGMGMGMSAAAAASAGAAGALIAQNRSKGPIALAAESLETAVWWRNSMLECIAQAEEQWKRYLNWYMDKDHDQFEVTPGAEEIVDGSHGATPGMAPASINTTAQQQASLSSSGLHPTRARSGSFGTVPRSIAKTFRTSATFSQESSWKLYEFSSKIRVDVERAHQHSVAKASPPPALRTSMKVMASPKKVFEMLMKPDSPFYSANHVIQEAKVLEEHTEDHSDVVYWKLAPTFLWPFYAEARDLCLLRYWRKEQDSSYFICFQSTTHAKCPTSTFSVLGSVMGGGFIISPRVHAEENFEECWVTLTIQMNPKGWIDTSLARSWYYMHAYGAYFLEMITAITSYGGDQTHRRSIIGADPALTGGESLYPDGTASTTTPTSQLIVSETKFPLLEPYRTDLAVQHGLPTKFWSEPGATGFFIRSSQYLSTKAKIPSQRQALRLVSVELYKSKEPVEHIGLSSFVGFEGNNNVGDAPSGGSNGSSGGSLATPNDQSLVLIINFMIPGPPFHSLVLYFTPEDPTELTKNSVFADLFHEFFYGANDEFRSKRLKLIPRVVQGTWPIREGVGTTPAILGTKTYQKYFQGKQYLEIDYDIGSSTVAASISKLLLGYSRDLIIDLAFVIEGQTSLELPERVLGCVRLDCIDVRHAMQYTKPSKE